MHQNVIVLTKDGLTEVWGSLTEICTEKEFSHNYLKRKKYPFRYKGIVFQRLPFKKAGGIVPENKIYRTKK